MNQFFLKRASIFGALFFWSELLANNGLPASCQASANISHYEVSKVFDGDTIHLKNGWKVRFIGVNTPEVSHDNKPGQPFALEAKSLVERVIMNSNSTIGLIAGTQTTDHYGRKLGHVFTTNGENLGALLLQRGLGFRLSIPPNLDFQDCYAQMEQQARSKAIGVWQGGHSLVTESKNLDRRMTGFRLVRGIITDIEESRHHLWLHMGKNLVLQIRKSDLDWFNTWKPETLAGKRIEARGWITSRKHPMKMRIQHPASISILE
jgi:endonuclease YncB( thermonuclease family)